MGPPGLEPEANLLPNHFSYPTASELQTDYTRYDTVFNSDAAQYAQFSVRAWRLTFHLTSNSAECKIYEIAGQTVIYSFRSITRNITRRLFLSISL